MLTYFSILISAIVAFCFLATPADRIFDSIKLPLPPKGSRLSKALLYFYRSLGVIALAFGVLLIFTLLTKR